MNFSIRNRSSRSTMNSATVNIVEQLTDLIHNTLSDMPYDLYLTGSAARGDFISHVSDIDICIVSSSDLPHYVLTALRIEIARTSWAPAVKADVSFFRLPSCGFVDSTVMTRDEFVLITDSFKIFGTNTSVPMNDLVLSQRDLLRIVRSPPLESILQYVNTARSSLQQRQAAKFILRFLNAKSVGSGLEYTPSMVSMGCAYVKQKPQWSTLRARAVDLYLASGKTITRRDQI